MNDVQNSQILDCGGSAIVLRPLTASDEAAVLAFARGLPDHDLLFLARDLTQPKVVAAWIDGVAEGRIHSLLALAGTEIAGYTALVRDELSWSPHVGDIRVLVAPAWRGKGLGRLLVQQTFRAALELGLEKLTARMTVDQRGAIAVFEELGFRGEALLKDHVRGRDGTKHDLAILSHDVARVAAQMAAYGVTEAV